MNAGFRTKKTPEGFKAVIYKIVSHDVPVNGRYATNETLREFTCSSRAKALYHAKKLVRYYRAQEAS